MPSGIYKHKPQQGFRKGHSFWKLAKKTLGKTPWNKGKIGVYSQNTLKSMSDAKIGKKKSELTRKKFSDIHKGKKSHFWKGGITEINKLIRSSLEYKLWRESVFKRDNWTCVWCNKRGVKLNADHIKPFAIYPELRFDVSNGRTLCIKCHENTDTFKGRIFNYKKNE